MRSLLLRTISTLLAASLATNSVVAAALREAEPRWVMSRLSPLVHRPEPFVSQALSPAELTFQQASYKRRESAQLDRNNPALNGPGLIGAMTAGIEEIWPILRTESKERLSAYRQRTRQSNFDWPDVVAWWRSKQHPEDAGRVAAALAELENLGLLARGQENRLHFLDSTDEFVRFSSESEPEREAGALILYAEDQFHILLPRIMAEALDDKTKPVYRETVARLVHESVEILCLNKGMKGPESHFQASRVEEAYRRGGPDAARPLIADLRAPYRAAKVEMEFLDQLRRIRREFGLPVDLATMSQEDADRLGEEFSKWFEQRYPSSQSYLFDFGQALRNVLTTDSWRYMKEEGRWPKLEDLAIVIERLHSIHEGGPNYHFTVRDMSGISLKGLLAVPYLSQAQTLRFLRKTDLAGEKWDRLSVNLSIARDLAQGINPFPQGLPAGARRLEAIKGLLDAIGLSPQEAVEDVLRQSVKDQTEDSHALEQLPEADQRKMVQHARRHLEGGLEALVVLIPQLHARGVILEQALGRSYEGWTFRARYRGRVTAVRLVALRSEENFLPQGAIDPHAHEAVMARIPGSERVAQPLRMDYLSVRTDEIPTHILEIVEWVPGRPVGAIARQQALLGFDHHGLMKLAFEILEGTLALSDRRLMDADLHGMTSNGLLASGRALQWVDFGQIFPWELFGSASAQEELPSMQESIARHEQKRIAIVVALNLLVHHFLHLVEEQDLWWSADLRTYEEHRLSELYNAEFAAQFMNSLANAWKFPRVRLKNLVEELRALCQTHGISLAPLELDGIVGARSARATGDSWTDPWPLSRAS